MKEEQHQQNEDTKITTKQNKMNIKMKKIAPKRFSQAKYHRWEFVALKLDQQCTFKFSLMARKSCSSIGIKKA